ncbi:DUF2568 domain-containing protein [Cellulosimicrobium sp. CUA-896]|uniref:DUF2568 domain-containing protein n=1 Tax=Cellulosimicrobium sp. CUA-896 TaxID=1517881 RepID=UPI000A86383B|nr:DUF2568 domain-containing protein [Cellulosimicrobium sp. CUA-896]
MTADDRRGPESRRTARPRGRVGVADVAAVACEVALLVLVAVAGWRTGAAADAAAPLPTVLGIVLALALPAAVVAVWARWLARTAAHRLPQPWRLDVQVALLVAAGLAVAGVGLVWWGVGLALVGTTAFALTRDR